MKKKPHPAALLAHAATSIAAGSTVTTKLTLNPAGRGVTRHLPARVRVLLSSRDKTGTLVTRLVQATVRHAKPHRHHR